MTTPKPVWLDGSLYPDVEVPACLETLAEQVDFVARVCGAWDFGVLPRDETVAQLKRPEWREAVDVCRFLTSPAYHLLRQWHSLEPVPYLGQRLAFILEDPSLGHV